MLRAFEQLGALYKDKLGWIDEAIDAYEAAQTLDPDNRARAELLGTLYASDPAQYLDKAVAAQARSLRQNPYRPDPYKRLRRLYTETQARRRGLVPLPGALGAEPRRAGRGALLPAHALGHGRRRPKPRSATTTG